MSAFQIAYLGRSAKTMEVGAHDMTGPLPRFSATRARSMLNFCASAIAP